MPPIDLRAHYSAPSTRADDTRFQAQAAAYLAFDGAHTTRLDSRKIAEGAANSHTILTDDTQAAVLALETQLCGSVTAKQARSDNESRPENLTTDESPSSRTNSSHLRTPVFKRSDKRRRYNFQARTTPELQPNLIPAEQYRHGHTEPEHPNAAVHVTTSPQQMIEDTTSELPTSYSLSDLTSDRSKSAARSVQRSVSDPGPITSSASLQAGVSGSTPQRTGVDESTESLSIEPRGSPGVTHPELNTRATHNGQPAFRLISPPTVCIGIGPFNTHITNRIQYLIDQPKLQDIYHSLKSGRELRTSERGHWCFSIGSWSRTFQDSFWSFLADFISCDVEGCGIMCTWYTVAENGGKDIIKAFCWGEIVKHTYLLLYVASQSRTRRLKLRWIDAAGDVVITS